MTCLWDGTSLIPPNITPQQAASIPIPFATAVKTTPIYNRLCLYIFQMQCLHYKLPVPEDPQKLNGEWIVIWSGVRYFSFFYNEWILSMKGVSGWPVCYPIGQARRIAHCDNRVSEPMGPCQGTRSRCCRRLQGPQCHTEAQRCN